MNNIDIKKILDYYRTPGTMTSVEKYKKVVAGLPDDITKLVKIIQGLIIHPFTARSFYGYEVPEKRNEESNIRYFDEMLDKIFMLDASPLDVKRSTDKRLVGVCHHFAKFLVTVLRAKGIPARMRYGFGSYFTPGFYEDHSLCEFWNEKKEKWIFVDPQFDEIWIRKLKIDHNVLDVPKDRFLVPGAAWIACREGKLNPETFGLSGDDMRGLWFIAGNLVKDTAALNKMELLQWDVWKGMPKPHSTMKNKKLLVFFDKLALLTIEPDANFAELKKIYVNDDYPISVPERVFNTMHRHLERITGNKGTAKQIKTKT